MFYDPVLLVIKSSMNNPIQYLGPKEMYRFNNIFLYASTKLSNLLKYYIDDIIIHPKLTFSLHYILHIDTHIINCILQPDIILHLQQKLLQCQIDLNNAYDQVEAVLVPRKFTV